MIEVGPQLVRKNIATTTMPRPSANRRSVSVSPQTLRAVQRASETLGMPIYRVTELAIKQYIDEQSSKNPTLREVVSDLASEEDYLGVIKPTADGSKPLRKPLSLRQRRALQDLAYD